MDCQSRAVLSEAHPWSLPGFQLVDPVRKELLVIDLENKYGN